MEERKFVANVVNVSVMFVLMARISFQACPGTSSIIVGSGVISSPNYPSNYPNNAECIWNLTTVAGHKIKLSFPTFRLGYDYYCQKDVVELYDGQSTKNRLLGKYCGTSKPAAMFSSGRYMYVRFVSNASDVDSGFQAQYESVPDDQGNSKCVWKMTAPAGYVIKLLFTGFNLEHCSQCTCDYVELSNSQNFHTDLIWQHCGSSVPSQIVSTGQVLWVKFVSDVSTKNRQGFQATYTMMPKDKQCHNSGVNLTAPLGSISSANYPNNYPANTRCTWHITAPTDHVVKLVFKTFYTEHSSSCTADYIQLSNTGDFVHETFRTYCGSNIPNAVYSSGRNLWVRFVSDVGDERQGFKAVYFVARKNVLCPGSGSITAAKGVLQSVDYPIRYPDNSKCIWKITAPVGHVIKIQFDVFDIQYSSSCTADYLEVRDGLDSNGKQLLKTCGTSYRDLYSSDRYLWIKFSSDFWSTDRGFRAVYSTAVQNQVCLGSGVMNASTGTLQTVNYPTYYPVNTRCTWKLVTPVVQKIMFTISDLDISSCSSCACASLEVYDGQDSTTTKLARYCGRYSYAAMFSTGRYMFLKFSTDHQYTSKGFSANYRTVPENGGNSTTYTGCFNSGEINGTYGTIKTPNYPSFYPGNTKCAWKIRVPDGLSVRLEFDDISLSRCSGCNCDYLEIYDGSSESARKIIKTCSNSETLFYSSGQFMYVVFRSDAQSSDRGFTASFRALPVSRGCPAQGVITGTSGYITSPEFPNNYPSKASCQWRIITPPRHRLIFTFHVFTLESVSKCKTEYLMIKNSDDAGAVLDMVLNKRCGSHLSVKTVAASGRSAYLFFVSDSSQVYQGFNVTYYAQNQDTPDCPMNGRINANSGVIQSPGYPSPYQSFSKCTWVIAVPSGYRVRLQFSTACWDSWLSVWDGNSTSDRLITSYCGDANHVYYSTTSYMRLNFACEHHSGKCAALRAIFTADKVPICPAVRRPNHLTGVITSPVKNYKGFNLTYTLVEKSVATLPPSAPTSLPSPVPTSSAQRQCHSGVLTLSGMSGLISHHHTSDYLPNMHCTWLIAVPPNYRVKLTFILFDAKQCASCNCDYVMVKNGNNMYSDRLSNQYETVPMVETGPPPPYAPYSQPHTDVKGAVSRVVGALNL